MRSRAAAIALQQHVDDDGNDHGALLLLDIRTVLMNEGFPNRIASAYLAGELGDMEDRPWAEWRGTDPITAPQLAKLLKPFGVRPKKMRINEKGPVQGYESASFKRVFRSYLPEQPEQPEQLEQKPEGQIQEEEET